MQWKQALSQRAKALKTAVPALYLAMRHPETPVAAKIMGAVTVAYALSPIDLIPDFIPVLGYLDDVLLLPALVALTIKWIPAPLWEECKKQAEGLWQSGKPKRWYYALPIAAVWLLVLGLVAKIIFF